MRTRSTWYAAAAGVVGLVAVTAATLWQLWRDRPAPKADPPTVSVRVEHELVTAGVIEPVRVVPAAAGAAHVSDRAEAPSRRRATASTTVSTTTRDATFVQKARRAFLGDGRHRPQPFPTVR